MKKVSIIGAGLAGTLMALFFARRNYEVHIFEMRRDLRFDKTDRGRSINLALSCRGITALNALNLMPLVQPIAVPMRARAIHEENGALNYQAFGRNLDESIYSISRKALNIMLLNEAEKNPAITLHFECELTQLNVYQKTLLVREKNGAVLNHAYEHLIGADGVGSFVRNILLKAGLVKAEREFLAHGYKELTISKNHSETLPREHLQLWPRGSFLLLGNPNPDDSITGSLFLPQEGTNSFSSLQNEQQVQAFFEKSFADVASLMPNLQEEFFAHPTGTLSTVHCTPWHYEDSCLLIGDAAHGIVPFFGQGMNSAFEDCRILDELLENSEDDWAISVPKFYELRKNNTEAVAQLSMENYKEIYSDIKSSQFRLKKQIEKEIMHRFPEMYVSMHVMVMFTNTSYAQAQAQYGLQNQLLDTICSEIHSIEEVDWNQVGVLVKNYDKKLADIFL